MVATPIGNLGDLSPRAREALAGADVIACEDTRRTRALLTHAGIAGAAGRLVAVHDHNEATQVPALLRHLDAGRSVAMVTDAGTPGVADPGERVVAAAAAAGHRVEAIPGPSALVSALVASGISSARFCFEGFLPRKGSARAERLEELRGERRTVVLYEAPHRVGRTLRDLAEVLGADRRIAVCRELTKLHEEIWRGPLRDALVHFGEIEPRGEYTIVLAGAPPPEPAAQAEVEAALRAELAAGAPKRAAIAAVASRLDVPRRQVYEVATRIP
ncbi:MAG: 16S rRNA (cytidine(1402)-2'-O)-methyltransferase [Acidimicrobiales bacterium]